MPELPEVETVKRSLKELVLNKKIVDVEVYYSRMIQTDLSKFKTLIINQTITNIERVGKFLVFILNDYIILSHLRMEGKYFLKQKGDIISKHDHVIFKFDDQTELRYNDTRKFGVIYLFETNKLNDVITIAPLNKLGLEPGDSKLTIEYLKNKFSKIALPIKSALLDQSIISGLGNIYADEVVFMSKLHPQEPACNLSDEDLKNIIVTSEKVIRKAIKLGGTTIKSFVNSHSATGLFQNELLIHTKSNCPICNQKVTKIFVGGRGTYYCSKCQKKKKPIVAITGSIATGKSTVSQIISELGFTVIDLDLISQDIYNTSSIMDKMKNHFESVIEDGKINRKALGQIIFNNKDQKELLNSITHPAIISKMKKEIKKSKDDIIFVDFPLLYENNYQDDFDYVILSYVPKNIQKERLIKRDNIDEEYAIKKINSQIDIEEKKKKSNFIVDNSSVVEYTRKQIEEIINKLRGA